MPDLRRQGLPRLLGTSPATYHSDEANQIAENGRITDWRTREQILADRSKHRRSRRPSIPNLDRLRQGIENHDHQAHDPSPLRRRVSASTSDSDRSFSVQDAEPANPLRHYGHRYVSEANCRDVARFEQYASTSRSNDDEITPTEPPQVRSRTGRGSSTEILSQEESGCCLPGFWCVWTSRIGMRHRLSKSHLRPPLKTLIEKRSDESLVRAGPPAEEYIWTLCSRNWWISKKLHMRRWVKKIGWRDRRSAAARHGFSGQ